MLFLGLAPCAPFLPKLTERASGDLSYVAASMALTAVGTMIYMPFAVPVLVNEFAADPWIIAKLLVLFIEFLLSSVWQYAVLRRRSRGGAANRQKSDGDRHPGPGGIGLVDLWERLSRRGRDLCDRYTVAVLRVIGCRVVYLSSGLPHGQKSVIALSLFTRNIGAATPTVKEMRTTKPVIFPYRHEKVGQYR